MAKTGQKGKGARMLSTSIKEILQLYDDIITHISMHRVKPSNQMIRKIMVECEFK